MQCFWQYPDNWLQPRRSQDNQRCNDARTTEGHVCYGEPAHWARRDEDETDPIMIACKNSSIEKVSNYAKENDEEITLRL